MRLRVRSPAVIRRVRARRVHVRPVAMHGPAGRWPSYLQPAGASISPSGARGRGRAGPATRGDWGGSPPERGHRNPGPPVHRAVVRQRHRRRRGASYAGDPRPVTTCRALRVARPPDESPPMSLHGLLDAVVKDAALAEAVAGRRRRQPHARRPGRPARRPPLRGRRAGPRGRAARCSRSPRPAARPRTWPPPCARCCRRTRVAEYPSWETLPHERLSPAQRHRRPPPRRAAPARAPAAPTTRQTGPVRSSSRPSAPCSSRRSRASATWSRSRCAPARPPTWATSSTALAAAAYARVELVEKRGEFAVRGGILDVFPPTEEHPLRVEFWGDDVEEIRYFKVADQRSLEVAEHGLWAPPCRELLLTDDVRARAAALAEAHPELGELLGKIAEGIAVEGMESLAPVLVDDMELLLDVLPEGLAWPSSATRSGSAPGPPTWWRPARSSSRRPGRPPPGGGEAPDRRRRGLPVVHRGRPGPGPRAGHDVVVGVPVRRRRGRRLGRRDTLKLGMHAPEAYRGDTARALADTKGWLADGWRTVVRHRGRTARPPAPSRCSAARASRPAWTPTSAELAPVRRARGVRLDRLRLRRPGAASSPS